MGKKSIRIPGIFKVLAVISAVLIIVVVAGVMMLRVSPATSAYGADALRQIIGDKPVAVMETALFQLQDKIKSVEYHAGLAKQENPFGSPGSPVLGVPTPSGLGQPGYVGITGALPAGATPEAKITRPSIPNTGSQGSVSPGTKEWALPVITGLDGQPGANQWQPYLQTPSGQVVAYRAYVQPDPTRPYAYTAIVAFDLHNLRLNYVLGTSEPYAPGVPRIGKGVIPAADKQTGMLIAAFNGGFKYVHGHSGSMLNSQVTVPPRDGFGTVAIYKNGEVKIGEWGKDIQPSSDLVAYRQNGPLLIQNGKINQLVDDPNLWGLTLAGKTVTFRSGMAISADQHTLYYFAGQYLSAPVLANAMETVHPQAAIQLDINNYWVYFSEFHENNGQLVAEPLLPKAMIGGSNRFLRPYSRDFFYLVVTH